ncbi:MAG: porin [Sulfurimonas sp.]|nr:porin [Sulfurimonas sp.]
MKLTKMSLVAALLIGSSAFAIENVKVAGDAKLFYSTSDEGQYSLTDYENSMAQAGINVGLTADLTEGVSAGVSVQGLSSLGLENQMVAKVWEGSPKDSYWFDEAWIAGTLGKTTAKVGRMELDTPLVYTEKWSMATNTFEAGVLINQDIPDTTLVGAYVGSSNGATLLHPSGTLGAGGGVTVDNDNVSNTTFNQFYNGAYAVGAVNNSFKPLNVQAWYYDATRIVNSSWLQADLSMSGFILGAQYTAQDDQTAVTDSKQSAYALKAGYEIKDIATLSAAYSSTSNDNVGGSITTVGANYATLGSYSAASSKLYTEMWWAFGNVSATDTKAYNIVIESPVNGLVDLYASYSSADHGNDSSVNPDATAKEVTVTLSKSFGPLDTTLAYINYDSGVTDTDAVNYLQAYLTYNF